MFIVSTNSARAAPEPRGQHAQCGFFVVLPWYKFGSRLGLELELEFARYGQNVGMGGGLLLLVVLDCARVGVWGLGVATPLHASSPLHSTPLHSTPLVESTILGGCNNVTGGCNRCAGDRTSILRTPLRRQLTGPHNHMAGEFVLHVQKDGWPG